MLVNIGALPEYNSELYRKGNSNRGFQAIQIQD